VDLNLFLRGLVIGFSIAAPVGPIGVLCIRRTLAEGRAYGLASGVGAASADGFYGLIAALGLTLVADFLKQQQMWLSLIGGGYLLYLGVKTFRSAPAETAADAGAPPRGLIGAYASTLFLTLTNPLTIFAFAAIFAGVGAAGGGGGGSSGALLVVAGVFAGSCAWWLILVTFTGLFRARLGPIGLRWINRLSGIVIAAFGAAVLVSLIAQS